MEYISKILSGASLLGGLLAYVIFIPSISLSPSGSFSANDPFEIPFLLTNESFFAIKTIRVSTEMISVTDARNNSFVNVKLVSSLNDSQKLDKGRQTTVSISLTNAIEGLGLPFQEGVVNVEVSYDWFFIHKVENFKFKLKQQSNNQAVWLPTNI